MNSFGENLTSREHFHILQHFRPNGSFITGEKWLKFGQLCWTRQRRHWGESREWETRIWGLWLANRDWGGNLPTVTWTPPCCINVRTRSIDNKLWVAVCLSGQGSQTNLFMTMLLLCYLTRSVPPSTKGRVGCQVCVRVSVLPTHVMTYTNICSNNQPMATTRTDKRDTSIKSDKKFDNKSKCEPKARRVEVFLKRHSSSVYCCSIRATLMHLLSTQKDNFGVGLLSLI